MDSGQPSGVVRRSRDSASVLSGISQGSILGPILFTIYINDLPDSLNVDSNIYLFADNAKLFRLISSSQDSISLQEDINKLTHSTDEWLIKLNITIPITLMMFN